MDNLIYPFGLTVVFCRILSVKFNLTSDTSLDLARLWKNTQEELKVVVAPAVFQTFIANTLLVSLTDNTAQIACPNAYLADLNRRRYASVFKSALDHIAKSDLRLEFVIQDLPKVATAPLGPLFTSPSVSEPPASVYQYTATSVSNLHPRYTFQNLIVGNSNNFAYAAAQGIVSNPGTTYNPLFIWGGVGVGKTHLMQAIGHELLSRNPGFKIRYFPAETFANELISALKSKSINQFKDKYRHADCLLVDDIQFIAGKEYIQEEFFHTFNHLHLGGKQVILTSDRRPDQIQGLEDRLVSRFLGGLTVDIQAPDLEMRVAIIRQKLESLHITSDPAAVSYLAETYAGNIREIEGKIQIVAVQLTSKGTRHLSLNHLTSQNFDTASTPKAAPVTARHLISVCAKFFNLRTSDLCGAARQKQLVSARHLTAFLLLTELNLPLDQVGHLLGGRDHTSIIHARDKVRLDLSTNPQTQKVVHQIKQLIYTA